MTEWLDKPRRTKLKKSGSWVWSYMKPYRYQSKKIYHLPKCFYWLFSYAFEMLANVLNSDLAPTNMASSDIIFLYVISDRTLFETMPISTSSFC